MGSIPTVGTIMKVCPGCHTERELTDFVFKNKRRGIRQSRCKFCTRARGVRHYQENKNAYISKARRYDASYRQTVGKYVVDYLMCHPCVDCGNGDIDVLDFDHVRGKKYKEVSLMVKGRFSLEKVRSEISKCEIRCANCHRKRHKRLRDEKTRVLYTDMA